MEIYIPFDPTNEADVTTAVTAFGAWLLVACWTLAITTRLTLALLWPLFWPAAIIGFVLRLFIRISRMAKVGWWR